MRVNMDGSVASDPRFKLVAAALGVPWTQVAGSCYCVWLTCYERRSKRLRKVEADVAAELSGFADALVAEKLATDCGDGTIEIHGVEKRIAFLNAQAERGSKGGKKRKKSETSKRLANASATASDTVRNAQANTPTPAPDLSPAPAPALDPPHPPRGADPPSSRRRKPKGSWPPEVRDATERFVAAFNGCLQRSCRVEGWEPSVKRVLAEGYGEAQLRAVAWWAGQEWGDDDEWRKRVSPKTLLKLQSSQGNRTFPEYLALASELWRDTHDGQTPPWEANGGAT